MPRADNACAITSEEHYSVLVREVIEAKAAPKKTSKQYRRLKKYDILLMGASTTKLIKPATSDENSGRDSIKYYIHYDEIFDILHASHTRTGHGGIHKMEHNMRDKYANISRPIIHLFLKHCETCVTKRAHPKKGVVVKLMVFKEVNARAQLDLIDMQICRHAEIMVTIIF